MSEMDLLNSIRIEVEKLGCKSFRINVGSGRTTDGRFFSTGVPKGFSDCLVIRPDGKAVFIETKIHPRKPTKEQVTFLLAMLKQGCAGGVAYTVDEALKIVKWEKDFAMSMEINLRGLLNGNRKLV